MKIEFDEDNRSSIEFKRNGKDIYIIITAPSNEDVNSLIVNTASINESELNDLLSDINFVYTKKEEKGNENV